MEDCQRYLNTNRITLIYAKKETHRLLQKLGMLTSTISKYVKLIGKALKSSQKVDMVSRMNQV